MILENFRKTSSNLELEILVTSSSQELKREITLVLFSLKFSKIMLYQFILVIFSCDIVSKIQILNFYK